MTETLRQEVVQMKAKGSTLLATAIEVGCSRSVTITILQVYNNTNSFKSPKKAGCQHKTNAQERIMQSLSGEWVQHCSWDCLPVQR